MTTPFSIGAISIASINPVGLPNDGGYDLEITGVFRDEAGTVTLDDGNGHLFVCYSASAGQSYSPRPRSSTLFHVATPPLPSGLYDVTIEQTGHTATLALALFIYPPNRRSRTRDFRQLFSPIMRVGALDAAPELHTQMTVAAVSAQSNQVGDAVSLAPVISANPSSLRAKWSISAGTLPAGLSINASTGAITGSLTTPAVSSFTRRASTIKGDVDTVISWTVLNVDTFVVVAGNLGMPTSATFDAQVLTPTAGGHNISFVSKMLTADGVTQWALKWFDSDFTAVVGGMTVDDSGNIYVVGHAPQAGSNLFKVFDVTGSNVFTRTISNQAETVLTKYNKDGVHQWSRALKTDVVAQNVTTHRNSIVLMSNGDVTVAVNLFSSTGGNVKLQSFDGAATTDVITYPASADRYRAALVRYSPAGAVVGHKAFTVTTDTDVNPTCETMVFVLSKKNAAQGIAAGHYLFLTNGGSGPIVNHCNFGAGEAGTITKNVTADNSIFNEAFNRYADVDLQANLTFNALQADPSKDVEPMGVDVDSAGNVYHVGIGQTKAGASTLAVNSADWAAPQLTIPTHSDASYPNTHYGKHNAAGVAQWLKGLGATSVLTNADGTVSDISAKDTTPYITGYLTDSMLVKLDEGLGSEVDLVGNAAPRTRAFYAKLDPTTGNVAACKRVNGANATTGVPAEAPRIRTLRQSLVAIVFPYSNAGLIVAPGEGDVALTAPASGSQVVSALILASSVDLSLSVAKRIPTSAVGADNVLCEVKHVCGAKA